LTTAFVLDVSATLPWCFEDEASAGSIALLDRLVDAVAVVPALWHVELANALLQGELRKRIDPIAAMEFLALIDSLSIETDNWLDHRVVGTLLAVARQYRLTAYDSVYLEVAVRRGLPLATRDAALRGAARGAGVALIDS
jgi:predicted nucleic acid-binding protein